jgi:2,3-bisphosphoglycerate-independent phosphoglycerate mutase
MPVSPDRAFYPGVSYRTILVLSGPDFSHRVKTEKPDDNHGSDLAEHMPSALEPDAEATSFFLRKLMKEAPAVLNLPVNKKRAEKASPGQRRLALERQVGAEDPRTS